MVTASLQEKAHELIGQLGDGQLSIEESDTLSPAERKAVQEADEWLKHNELKHNEPVPHVQVLAELGLSPGDWQKMADEPLPEESPRRDG